MRKVISTRTHGILDYATVIVLYALPRGFGWSGRVRRFLTFMSVFLLGYSAFTRYELGIFKQLSMRGHLTFDAMSGLLMALSPAILKSRSSLVNATLIGLGLYEIGASMMTKPTVPPRLSQPEPDARFETRPANREYVNG